MMVLTFVSFVNGQIEQRKKYHFLHFIAMIAPPRIFAVAFAPPIRLQLLRHTPLDPPPERLVMIQVVVVVLACILAFLCALTLAGISLSAFGKLLRHTDNGRDKQSY
ncbi:MAG TPA: hypothetical protein VKA60_00750 [Blastocatellia bacterium]|nr:hypothetical protein [Blastocatellia bacterium]